MKTMILCFAIVTAFHSAAHAQCSNMSPRLGVAPTILPGVIPGFRLSTHIAKQAGGADPSIVGMWQVTFTSGGQITDQAFETFHDDGTEMMVDTSAPASGNVCTGVWARTGTLTVKLNHPAWTFDDKGNLNGTASIKLNITLDPNSNSFTGTYTVDVFTLSGLNVYHEAGTVAGKRIEVD
jgi:hypothetical protein